MTTAPPVKATGPEAAAGLYFTDPRVTALARAAYHASPDDERPWTELDWHQQHPWRIAARDWLRAAVTIGLLPLVKGTTGDALAAVPLDVDPDDGRPRAGSRGRAAAFRAAAHAVRPDAFGWGGPDHHDAWDAAEERLQEIADAEDESAGDMRSPDHLAAALARVEAWADRLDEVARRKHARLTATDPTADILRALLDGARHGEDPR
ncbi:hypothetical protein ABZ543_08330 [Streptomyces roseifaciens]